MDKTECKIREYNKTDFENLLSLLEDYFEELEKIEPKEVKPSRQWLIDNCIISDYLTRWLMTDGDKIIGFALVGFPPNCHPCAQKFIYNFYISPEYRRKGLGRKLAEKALGGAETICLYIIKENWNARYFWGNVLKDYDVFPYPDLNYTPRHTDFYLVGKTRGKLK